MPVHTRSPRVRWRWVTYPYFDFISSAQLEIAPNYPLFSGPPANVQSNIDNGAYGIFTGVNVKGSTVLP